MKTFNNLKERNILSSIEMSYIKGGGTCGYKIVDMDTREYKVECEISIEDIQVEMDHATYLETEAGRNIRFNWCCDSCASSSYCKKL